MTIKDLKNRLKELDEKYDNFIIEVDDNCGGGYRMTGVEIVKTDQGTEVIVIQ